MNHNSLTESSWTGRWIALAGACVVVVFALATPSLHGQEPRAGEAVRRPVAEAGESGWLAQALRQAPLVPFSQKRQGRIGAYALGTWPYESGTPRSAAYAPPRGFIEVTPQNRSLRLSAHFQLQDFLNKDQPDVWPKYLALDPRLVDKLELVIQQLEAEGHPIVHVQVLSGFRTPRSNAADGDTRGRSSVSRHMYGDAADFFVDNDRDGLMDDLNGDGRVDVRDADLVARAADRVEARHAAVVGGIGVYAACCGHGPFVHVDARGQMARWRGTGAG